MTEAFAAVGVFATFAAAVAVLAFVAIAVTTSLKERLHAKRRMAIGTDKLLETQRALMEANNRLNERVKAIESELHGRKS